MNRMKVTLVVLTVLLAARGPLLAEGTKQILLSDAGHGKLSVMPFFSDFAWYNNLGVSGNSDYRLNIHIENLGETFYYGLGDPMDITGTIVYDVEYRIKDPNGNIVVGPLPVPISGTGYIPTFIQAVNGPDGIAGPSGYPALTYTPMMTGEYFIEFNFTTGGPSGHDRTKFKYFDITVANAANQPIDGRVWSKAWQCTADANGLQYDFYGTFYVYSVDSIVTSIYGNGMAPFVFTIACNQWGCFNTGNFTNDRRSVPGTHIIPQYKVFLNNPDSIVYPTGIIGQIVPPIVVTQDCPTGTATMSITVTKAGFVDMVLNINPLPGIQPEDRIISTSVTYGVNILNWDGLDGLGNPVPNGAIFDIYITYVNGLTNLPIYDPDDNPNGYIINLHRPSGPLPKVYWDDTQIGGGQNLTGCIYTLPTTGCHPFLINIGNNNTLNTWWNAATHVAAPVTYEQHRAAIVTAAFGPASACATTNGLMYWCTPVPNASSYLWNYSGTGATINGDGNNNDTVWVDFGPAATSGIMTVQGFNPQCGAGPGINLPVTVNPIPDLTNNPLFQTQCSGMATGIILTSSVPGTTFTWTCTASSGNVTGFAPNATGASLINQTLVNTGSNIETVTYHITPHQGPCSGPVYDYVVTVYPVPHVTNNPLLKSQCNNLSTAINLTANVTGTTFTWTCIPSSLNITGYASNFIPATSINQVLVNIAYNIETVVYRIIPTANGCSGPFTDYTVTIYPTPNLSNIPASKTQCNNNPTGVTLTSNVTGTLFTWTCVPSSASITGWSNNPVPTITLNQTLVNTGYNIETVTYRMTPHANGCDGPVTNYLVTVYPVPDLSNVPASKTICSNSPTAVNLTSNVAGTSFTWTCIPSSGNVTGWANNVVPTTSLNQVLVNTGTVNETVTYRLTPIANGCTGPLVNYVVTVLPAAVITTNPLNKSICNNTTTNITPTSNLPGTLYIWTCTPSSGNITGWANNNIPAPSINQLLVNSGNVNETVIYRITPVANGCPGTPVNYTVTVYPTPVLSNSLLSQSQCSNVNTAITLTSTVIGTQFIWTCIPSSANITGWANNAVPSTFINQVLINSGPSTESVTYLITPVLNGCAGSVSNYAVTVYPMPTLTNTPLSKSLCNFNLTNIVLTSNVPGTLFTWTCTASSGNITGYSNSVSPGVFINQTLNNSGPNTETVTYHITPMANGCAGPVTDYTVTVYPIPDLSNNPASQSQCNNTNTNITLTSNVTGTLFTWTCFASSGTLSGYYDGTIPATTINQVLVNSDITPEWVAYQLTPVANGCAGPVTDYIVSVFPTPHVTNSPASKSQCNNTNTNIILTSDVAGTLYTWTCTPSSGNITGYSNGAFPSPAINQVLTNTGAVHETVVYHITPWANGCPGPVVNYTVTVYPTPFLTNTPLSKSQCNSTAINVTLTSNVAGAAFTWICTPSSGNITGWSNNAIPTTLLNQVLVSTSNMNETVTYHITPSANGCTGPVSDYVVTVYPSPTVTNNPLSKTQCNNQNTAITLLSNVGGALFTWTCTPSSGNVTGWANNNIPAGAIMQTLVNAGFNTETVVYHITAVANGCSGSVFDYTVTVFPTPNLSNLPLSQGQCNNTNTGITLTSNVAGATFTWICTPSGPGITGWANNAVPSTAISQVLVNSTVTNQTVIYRITPSANGCTGAVTNYIVTVYPTPLLTNNPLSSQQCNNLTTNIALTSNVAGATFSWTCAPSSASITGFSPGSGALIAQTLVNSGNVTETVTYTITPRINGCPGPASNYVVSVYPTPFLTTSPLTQQQCSNQATNLALTSNVSGVFFTWTCTPSSNNVTGFSPGSGPLINQTLINSGNSNETVTYHITPSANGCTGPVSDLVVTVFPVPFLTTAPLSQTQCNDTPTNVVLTSNVPGTLFTWTCTPSSPDITGFANSTSPDTVINQTLNNSGINIETVTYHVTATANGCANPALADFVVTVYPTPDLTNAPAAQAQCNDLFTNITLTSNVPGTLFTWTATGSSRDITGYSDTTLPAGQINQLLMNVGSNIETVTYEITPMIAGCAGLLAYFVVTVYPTPDLSNVPPWQSQCSNINTALTLTSDVAGTLFTWTCVASSVNITGYSNSTIPGVLINQTLVNTGLNIEYVTYQITPHANGCDGPVRNYLVTIFPTPDLSNNPASQAQCNNINTNVTLTSNVPGALFTWTCTPSSPNITGYANSAIPGTMINQTLVNSGFITEWVTYEVTPTANGCVNGVPANFVVTVYPTPDISNTVLNQSQCSTVNTNISLTSNVPGTLFTWTCAASSNNVTGYANSAQPGTLISQVLVNTGVNAEWVTYHVTPTANACSGLVKDFTVTVYPSPVLSNNPASQGQCNNINTNITLTSSVPGTLFTWTCTPSSNNITGWANNAMPTTLLNQVLVNSGYTIEWVTYQVTPTANGCSGNPVNYVVTVFPVANVFFTPPIPVMCGGTLSNITNNSNVTGTAFTWTAVGTANWITGYGPGSGSVIAQTIINSGTAPGSVNYTVTPMANGCPGTPATVSVTVNPLPFTTFTICNDPVTTTNSRPVTLRGGIPLGGIYSGAGVAGNIFTPAVTGPGNHVITYTSTNSFGCSKAATQTLSVLAVPPFFCGTMLTDVRDNKQYPTLMIGTQCWMASNLNYGTIINSSMAQRDNCVVEKYCAGDVQGNCTTQGGFYQWDELMHYAAVAGDQGICPPGWHVPSETEWTAMFNTFGPRNNAIAGANLKTTGNSGFAANMIGFSGFNRSWNHTGFATMFWSSTSQGQFKAWAHGMNTPDDGVSTYPGFRANAFSVRCVRD